MSKDLHVVVLHSVEHFDALKNDWDELLDNSNQAVYFLRWSWNRLWWKAYAPLEGSLYLIVCYDKRQLVGLAPHRKVVATHNGPQDNQSSPAQANHGQ